MHQEGLIDIRLMAEVFTEAGFKEFKRYSHEFYASIHLTKRTGQVNLEVTLNHSGYSYVGPLDRISLTCQVTFRPSDRTSHWYSFHCEGQDAVDSATNSELVMMEMVKMWEGQE